MERISQIALKMAALSVYGGVLRQPVCGAIYRLLCATSGEIREFAKAWGEFMQALLDANAADRLTQAILQEVLYDQNAFSLKAAMCTEQLPTTLISAAERDLSVLLEEVARITPQEILESCLFSGEAKALGLPAWQTGEPEALPCAAGASLVDWFAQFYRAHGCGIFAKYRAFVWREQTLIPVEYPDGTELNDLKGYSEPRQAVLANTEAFLKGLPANNCLLYGDRGTGKSSTVKAILNRYYTEGLRVIEMPKAFLTEFPALVAQIADLPMKFIIFIDDLSFSQQDDTYASLKAVLEGGVAAKPQNTLIYATSNRRHLVRETFSERQGDEIHRRDTIQENISLADRFGLSVNFSMPGKEEYLHIVRELAKQRGLEQYTVQLELGAEQWALARGGRSPRCARQYMNAAEAKIKLGGNP